MNHRDLDYPVLAWTKNYAYLAKNVGEMERTSYSAFKELREQALNGDLQLLDASGMMFRVNNLIVITSENAILRWLFGFRTAPQLSGGRKLELDEFKEQIMKAIRASQKGGFGSDFVHQLRATLPGAATFREALDCVPRGI